MSHKEYFNYLRGRSHLGLWYRYYWLYPRLSRFIAGQTLDVGCGIGDFLKFRTDAIGVDINPASIEWCKSLGMNVHLMEPNKLRFNNETFDSVILDNVLEHIEAPFNLLSEIRRVLRPDKTLIVGVPGPKGYAADPDHKVFYDEASLTETVSQAGFKLHQLLFMPFRSGWLSRHMRQYCIYGVFQRD